MSTNSASQAASNYFLVDYVTGQVKLRQSLMNDLNKADSYYVSFTLYVMTD